MPGDKISVNVEFQKLEGIKVKTSTRIALLASMLAVVAVIVAACSSSTATPTPGPSSVLGVTPFYGVPGIVDPENHGWPRQVEGLNGIVTIAAKPQRIVTLSVGHDEMTYAIVPASRVVAVGSATKNPQFSNVAELAQDVPTVSREPESILSHNPDVMVTSPFIKAEVIQSLSNAGLTVIQTALAQGPEARIENILLLGYIYGEEERAVAFAQEVQQRFEALQAVVQAKPDSQRQRVMSTARFSEKIYTAGGNSTEGGIIIAAGGINVAEEAGLTRNPTISLESIIAMRPEVILVTQPADSGEEFRQDLLNNPALAEVPAIKDGQVYVVDNLSFTTLSHWNLVGAEKLARLLWPNDFEDQEIPPFSVPE